MQPVLSPSAGKTARNPRQARGQIRIDAVLDACALLLSRHGDAPLTMHGLAKAGGTSIGSLYHFFPDKQSVLQALRERHLIVLHEIVAQTNRIPDTAWPGFTSSQLTDQLLKPYLDYLTHNPDLLHLIRRSPEGGAAGATDQVLETRIQNLFLRVIALRLPMASHEEQQSYAATLFSLPVGMLTQQLLEYDPALRERILNREIPRAITAYIEAIEAAHPG